MFFAELHASFWVGLVVGSRGSHFDRKKKFIIDRYNWAKQDNKYSTRKS
jgi:hypothetical protein